MPAISVRSLHPRLVYSPTAVARALRVLERHRSGLGRPGAAPAEGELSVAFLTDEALAGLHGRWLDDPAPTDVITFPGDPALASAGEICVSADAARRQASASGQAFSHELALYLVHGWLHLAGHDDRAAGPRRLMRRAEARALALLKLERALPRFALR